MAYALHIEKEYSEISLDEWLSVIRTIDGARIKSEGVKAVNPSTGEEIIISSNPGDVEVLFISGGFLGFGKKFSWEPCIWFSNGRASFNVSEDIEASTNPVHQVAVAAAKALSAQIVGDEGEVYEW